jgi:hypothetical protein
MKLSKEVRSSLRTFAFLVANGSLEVDILDGIDYRDALVDYGSTLEMVFAIWSNAAWATREG